MRTLKKIIQDPRELHDWFPSELRAGYIFLPGVTQAGVGEEVCIWIQLPPYRAEIYLTGLVAWRRLQHMPGLPAGTGVGLRPGQVDELTFMGRLLTGDVKPLPERLHERTRILSPWSCTIVVPHLGKWSPAALTDISPMGARVELQMLPVHEGCQVQINLPWQSEAMHSMELVWYRTAGGQLKLGLRRNQLGELHEKEWDALVEAAFRHFQSQVLVL